MLWNYAINFVCGNENFSKKRYYYVKSIEHTSH